MKRYGKEYGKKLNENSVKDGEYDLKCIKIIFKMESFNSTSIIPEC